ncbi:hypothetical protein BH09MYX1_BH09MYX1_67460 [soil metagenome]
MKERDLYKQKYEAQLHEWSAKVDVMKAQSEKLSAQAKIDMKPKIDAVHANLALVKSKLSDIVSATDGKWNDMVKHVDATWDDFKAAVEGAHDAMTDHVKK